MKRFWSVSAAFCLSLFLAPGADALAEEFDAIIAGIPCNLSLVTRDPFRGRTVLDSRRSSINCTTSHGFKLRKVFVINDNTGHGFRFDLLAEKEGTMLRRGKLLRESEVEENTCIQGGIDYPGGDITSFPAVQSAKACGCKCHNMFYNLVAWSWGNELESNPLNRHRCWCKDVLKPQTLNKARTSGFTTCPSTCPAEAGTFNSEPLPFFNFESGVSEKPRQSEATDLKVLKHKDGYGVELKACASATVGVTAHIKIELDIRAVSSTIVRESAQQLQQYLKTEYQSKFQREIENVAFGVDFAWDWLGISASGKYSNSKIVEERWKKGSQGLEEARKQFTQSLQSSINSRSKITGAAFIPGTSPTPVEFCLFFRIQTIEFSNKEKMTVVIDDPNQAKTGTRDGKEVAHTGEIELDVITF